MTNQKSYILVLCAVTLGTCLAIQMDEISNQERTTVVPMNLDATIVLSAPLSIQNSNKTQTQTHTQTTAVPLALSLENSMETQTADTIESLENDYSFLADRIPDLPEDEYLEIGEDSIPLHFLKKQKNKLVAPTLTKAPSLIDSSAIPAITPTSTPTSTAESAAVASPAYPMTIASPIYITVPIYINTQGGLPLSLTVAGQQVPLGNGPTSALSTTHTPTSQLNKLLQYEDTPKRSAALVRQTNRHRSNPRSKIRARRNRNSPVQYRFLGGYSKN